MGEFVHVIFDERFEIEHHPRAALGIDMRPFRECGLRSFNSVAHLGPAREGRPRLHLACRRIIDVAEAAGFASDMPAADEMRVLFHAHAFAPRLDSTQAVRGKPGSAG